MNAETVTPCHHSWPDPNSIRTHVCTVDGDHVAHVCGACGEGLTAGDLTAEHIGMVVLDVPGIAGWERNLLLRDIDQREDGLWLGFRWNDDPSPQNTRRGQYACGQRVDPATPVRLFPPGSHSTTGGPE